MLYFMATGQTLNNGKKRKTDSEGEKNKYKAFGHTCVSDFLLKTFLQFLHMQTQNI